MKKDWLEHYRVDKPPSDVMCAYKLIKVEFRYWGMQVIKNAFTVECFHLRDYRPYWYTETKESICIKIEFNSQRFSLGHQHGRHFFVLGHQHGRHFFVLGHQHGRHFFVLGHQHGRHDIM